MLYIIIDFVCSMRQETEMGMENSEVNTLMWLRWLEMWAYADEDRTWMTKQQK